MKRCSTPRDLIAGAAPFPWRVVESVDGQFVVDCNYELVAATAIMSIHSDRVCEANSQLIVAAVNAFAESADKIEALEREVERLKAAIAEQTGDMKDHYIDARAMVAEACNIALSTHGAFGREDLARLNQLMMFGDGLSAAEERELKATRAELAADRDEWKRRAEEALGALEEAHGAHAVRDIRPSASGFIQFDHEPDQCKHAWERHLWEADEAYCPKCGSLATTDQSARSKS